MAQHFSNDTLRQSDFRKLNQIVLTDDDLLEDGERSDYSAGLFQFSKDEYLKAVAYNFSQTWFKLR